MDAEKKIKQQEQRPQESPDEKRVSGASPAPDREHTGTTREDMRRDTYTPARLRESAPA